MLTANPLERRLQFSGILLILGLLTETLCLVDRGPLAFVLFVGLGGVLVGAGMLLYLYSLVSSSTRTMK